MAEDYTELERLEVFANGFRFEPKLSARETPEYLQKEIVIESMRPLMTNTLKAGFAREVANIFDTQILVEAADITLLMDAASATAQSYGFEDAIDLTENVIAGLAQINDQDIKRLQKFFSGLYQNWVAVPTRTGALQSRQCADRYRPAHRPDWRRPFRRQQ